MPNNFAYLKQQAEKEVQERFIALINSCVEGYTGEWDPSNEGRGGFEDMRDQLVELAEFYKVDISDAKEIE
jgi:hypothetical protein